MSTTAQSDERSLLDRVAAGDQKAFERLFNEYHHFLGLHIYSILKSRELAEEITQDVFLRIWQTRETLSKIRSFKDYLFIITRNKALNALQKLATERKHLRNQYGDAVPFTDAHGATLDFKDRGLDLIDQAIENLPERQKQCYLMSRRDKLSYEEIALQLGIGRESVKSHIRAATAAISLFVKSEMDKALLLLWVLLCCN